MDRASFILHDLSTFPIVRLHGAAAHSLSKASAWCREIDALIGGAERFVLIYAGRQDDEPHDDRVTRGLWLKRNKAALAARCCALITVEPDRDRRDALEAAFPNLIRAFGTPQAACATDSEAVILAEGFLQAGGRASPETGQR